MHLLISTNDKTGPVKVLNLFAGIGGNRVLWKDCSVTAVEFNKDIADVYQKRFPNDIVVVSDAISYVEQNFSNFDFIWASPPCQSHGQLRYYLGVKAKNYQCIVPDMRSLYGLIVFLKWHSKAFFVVENTVPYYVPLIRPTVILQRHLFWANFKIKEKQFQRQGLIYKKSIKQYKDKDWVLNSNIINKRQVLRNLVDEKIGMYVYNQFLKEWLCC